MSTEWHYQLRIYLTDALAEVARTDRDHPSLQPLMAILRRHDATAVSQFDAFTFYVEQAEETNPDRFPLYRWTKATLEDPAKRAKHMKAFALRVAGEEVYPKPVADALEADLTPLVGGGAVTRLSRHDTNPANNLPIPPAYRAE